MQTSPKRRTLLLNALIWAAALGIGVWAWVQGIQALQAQLPPWRRLEIVGADGQPVADNPTLFCGYGSAFIDGETVWRYPCRIEVGPRDNRTEIGVLAQVRPAQGVIDVRWNMGLNIFISIDTPVHALARHASSGEFFLQSVYFTHSDDGNRLAERYSRLLPSGMVEELPRPAETLLDTRGAGWVGDAIQLIALPSAQEAPEREPTATRYTYSPDNSWSGQPVTLPGACIEASANCRLELAYLEADAWRLLYVNLPEGVTSLPVASATDTPMLELPRSAAILADEGGQVLPLNLPSNRVDPSTRTGAPDSDTWIAVSGIFDLNVANRPMVSVNGGMFAQGAMPYMYTTEGWQSIPAPPASLYEARSDLFISSYTIAQHLSGETLGDGPGWQLEFLDSGAESTNLDRYLTWIDGRWLLTRRPDGELIIEDTANLAPPATPDARVLEAQPVRGIASATLGGNFIIRAVDGGFWLSEWLGGDRYLHLDADFERVDAPNAWERVTGQIGSWRSTTRQWVWPAVVAAVALFGLPLLIVSLLVLLIFRHLRAFTWGWAWLPLSFIAVLLLGSDMLRIFLYDV